MTETIPTNLAYITIHQTKLAYDFVVHYGKKIDTKGTILRTTSFADYLSVTVYDEHIYSSSVFSIQDICEPLITIETCSDHFITGIAKTPDALVVVGYWSESSLFVGKDIEMAYVANESSFIIRGNKHAFVSSQEMVKITDVAVDFLGNAYVTGEWLGVDLIYCCNDIIQTTSTPNDGILTNSFIMAISKNITPLWMSLILASKRGLSAKGISVYDGIIATIGEYDTFLLAYNHNKTEQRTISNTSSTNKGFIALYDVDGQVLKLVSYDYIPTSVKVSLRSVYVQTNNGELKKYSQELDELWSRRIDYAIFETNTRSIVVDMYENVFIIGEYDQTIYFTNGFRLASPRRRSAFMVMYDMSGKQMCVTKILGSSLPRLGIISNNLYLSGIFEYLELFNGAGMLMYTAKSPSHSAYIIELVPYVQTMILPKGMYTRRVIVQETANVAGTMIIPEALFDDTSSVKAIIMNQGAWLEMLLIEGRWQVTGQQNVLLIE